MSERTPLCHLPGRRSRTEVSESRVRHHYGVQERGTSFCSAFLIAEGVSGSEISARMSLRRANTVCNVLMCLSWNVYSTISRRSSVTEFGNDRLILLLPLLSLLRWMLPSEKTRRRTVDYCGHLKPWRRTLVAADFLRTYMYSPWYNNGSCRQPQTFFHEGFDHLVWQWNKCINSYGYYFWNNKQYTYFLPSVLFSFDCP